MPTSSATTDFRLFRTLTADFQALAASTTGARALARWTVVEPDLAAYPTLSDLAAAAADRSDPARGWKILAALARLASQHGHDDQPEAARVLVQLLLPGARKLAAAMTWLPPEDRAAEFITELLTTIRTYRCHTRSPHTAYNLLRDTQSRLRRRGIAAARDEVPYALAGDTDTVGVHQPLTSETNPGEELLELLTWAAATQALPLEDLRLIGRSRMGGEDLDTLADTAGVLTHSLRRRRQRAETALRLAARAHQAQLAAA